MTHGNETRESSLPHRVFDQEQEGYGAFTVSRSDIGEVTDYIASQEEHHRKRTFQEEYIAFLEEQWIEYDPRYLW